MKSEPVGGGAERTDLFVVERNNGEWVNACDGTDYSCFLSLSEAEEALKAEADNCEEGESLYRIVRFTRVGASLSAQTLPTTWGYGCMNCGEEPCKCNKASVCKHCAYSIGIAKFGEFAGKYVHVLTGNWLCALSAEPVGGAAQEGDCPCGATVVRKSDSPNKSKLCADCAAQEEAPREDDHEKAMMEVLTERDEAQEWADNLAYAVGEYFDIDVGEHSSCSDPRVEAMKILKGEYVTKFDKPAQEEAPQVDTVEYWKSRATTAELKVLTFHEEIVKLRGEEAPRVSREWSEKMAQKEEGMSVEAGNPTLDEMWARVRKDRAARPRCGKNMGNDLLVIPCDLPNDHEGPCERNVWPVTVEEQSGVVAEEEAPQKVGTILAQELRRRCNTKLSLLHQSAWYEAANELERFADSMFASGVVAEEEAGGPQQENEPK